MQLKLMLADGGSAVTVVYSLFGLAAYLLLFWYLYILIMGLYRAYLDKRLNGVALYLAMPALIIGYAVDILSNWTVAAIWFREWPEFRFAWQKPDLVTDRLQRYLSPQYPDGHNKEYARLICGQLLDPFDPTGSHCDKAPLVQS